jgi:hypothetical protein
MVDKFYGHVDQGHRVVHQSTMDCLMGVGSALAGVGPHDRLWARILAAMCHTQKEGPKGCS